MGTECLFPRGRAQGMRLTTHPHVVVKFKGGVLRPFPLSVFMECLETTLCIRACSMHLMHNLITTIISGEKYEL